MQLLGAAGHCTFWRVVGCVCFIFSFSCFFFFSFSSLRRFTLHVPTPGGGGENSSPTYAVCRGAERGAARAGAARRGADRGAALGADLRPIVIPEV